jgi:cold shock CspA family protein
MAWGTIKALGAAGHHGFIAADGERADLYFQRDAVAADGFDALRVGQRVAFDVTPDPLKPDRLRAKQVRPAP